MAKEYKTLNAASGGENEAIEFWQYSGWELLNNTLNSPLF
jgi:hypothetical protein